MPEVIFAGPSGRIEGRYNQSKTRGAPIAIILHPHPQFGGTMNNKIVYELYYSFLERGFSTLRFNFRGVAVARAYSIMALANCLMRLRLWIGHNLSILMRGLAGLPAFPSERGWACSF